MDNNDGNTLENSNFGNNSSQNSSFNNFGGQNVNQPTSPTSAANNSTPQKTNHLVDNSLQPKQNYQSPYSEHKTKPQTQPQSNPLPTPPASISGEAGSQPEPPIKIATIEEHIVPSSDPQQSTTKSNRQRKSKAKTILTVFILLFLTFLVSSAALVYAVAYEKIEIANKPLQKKVAHFVMSYIPFAPPTPQFIFEKTTLAHKTVTKSSYDFSLALNTDQGSLSDFGFDNFDMKVSGAVDFTNPNNVLATADVSVTNAFGMQIITKDNILYLKVSKFPSEIFTLLNVDPTGFEPLIDQWFMYDTSTLESEARTFLDEEIVSDDETYPNELIDNIIDEKIIENINVSSENYNGYNSYKLEFVADGEMIDYLVEKAQSQSQNSLYYTNIEDYASEKPSDYIKEFKVLAWIEKNTFYTRKTIFSATIVTDGNSLDFSNPFGFFPTSSTGKTQITVTGAMLLDNFGEDVSIDTPDNPLEIEEVYDLLNKAVYGDSYLETTPSTYYPEESSYYQDSTSGADLNPYYYNPSDPFYSNSTSAAELESLYYYEFEDINDVLGWFDERLNSTEQKTTP